MMDLWANRGADGKAESRDIVGYQNDQVVLGWERQK